MGVSDPVPLNTTAFQSASLAHSSATQARALWLRNSLRHLSGVILTKGPDPVRYISQTATMGIRM